MSSVSAKDMNSIITAAAGARNELLVPARPPSRAVRIPGAAYPRVARRGQAVCCPGERQRDGRVACETPRGVEPGAARRSAGRGGTDGRRGHDRVVRAELRIQGFGRPALGVKCRVVLRGRRAETGFNPLADSRRVIVRVSYESRAVVSRGLHGHDEPVGADDVGPVGRRGKHWASIDCDTSNSRRASQARPAPRSMLASTRSGVR